MIDSEFLQWDIDWKIWSIVGNLNLKGNEYSFIFCLFFLKEILKFKFNILLLLCIGYCKFLYILYNLIVIWKSIMILSAFSSQLNASIIESIWKKRPLTYFFLSYDYGLFRIGFI